jgi:tetratricopeptide (TPR) repeat protein
LAFLLGDYKDAQVQITKSVNMWRKIGSKSGLAYALIILGMVEKEIGKDYQLAYQHEEESAQLLESVGDQWGYALALNDLGNIIAAQGESHYAEARQQYEESRRKWELINDRWGLSLTLSNLSSLECKERNYNVAYNLMQAALEIQLEANDKWGRAWSLKGMGESKLGLQDFSSAASYFYESFCSHLGLGRKQLVAECLEGLAKVAAALEQPQRAAYLIGAADKLRDEAGSRMSDTVDKDYEDVLNYLRGDMSRKMFDKARAEGRAWDNERLRRNVNSFFSEWK